MAIVYKITSFSHAILKRMVSLKHIGLVNMVPGKEIVKEFIQSDAIPQDIAREIIKILDDENYNKTMREELSKLRQLLGEGGGSKNVAELALKMLHQN